MNNERMHASNQETDNRHACIYAYKRKPSRHDSDRMSFFLYIDIYKKKDENQKFTNWGKKNILIIRVLTNINSGDFVEWIEKIFILSLENFLDWLLFIWLETIKLY